MFQATQMDRAGTPARRGGPALARRGPGLLSVGGFEGRPAPDGSRKGRSFPAPPTRRHGNAALLANRPGPGAARRASWAEPGMDSLFVEEVAASLVREFLSRKVRGVARADPADRCDLGRTGAPRQPLPLLLPASGMPDTAPRSWPERGSARPGTPSRHLPLQGQDRSRRAWPVPSGLRVAQGRWPSAGLHGEPSPRPLSRLEKLRPKKGSPRSSQSSPSSHVRPQ